MNQHASQTVFLNTGHCIIQCLSCLWFRVGVWRPATCWSQQTDRSVWQVSGASSVWSVTDRGPGLSMTSHSTASKCCHGSVLRCCSRYCAAFLYSHINTLCPFSASFESSTSFSSKWKGNRSEMVIRLSGNFICQCFFLRICKGMTLGQTSIALASQPVNWQMDMCPSRTCQPHRWSSTICQSPINALAKLKEPYHYTFHIHFVFTDAAWEAKWNGAVFAGHHHNPTRGTLTETVSLWGWLWDLRGSRSWRYSPLQRRALLLLLSRTPLQSDVLPVFPRLRWVMSTARPRKEVGLSLICA